MLVLPMNSPSSSPGRPRATSPYTHMQREESPKSSDLRNKVANTVISIVPTSSSPNPERPKLSLQTSLGSSRPSTAGRMFFAPKGLESPTARNTELNSFEAPPPTPASAGISRSTLPLMGSAIRNSPTVASFSSHTSPFPREELYNLPLGMHSILRNSPLPKSHSSATSARAPRRIFSLRKEVTFSEKPKDFAPTPVLEISEGEESDSSVTEEQHEDRRKTIQQEDGHSIAGYRRKKKRREWIWRPMDGDILLEHGVAEGPYKD